MKISHRIPNGKMYISWSILIQNRKYLFVAIILIATVLFLSKAATVQAAKVCPGLNRPCADGYYNTPNLARTITGVKTNMESAFPQVRDGGFSTMRVGVVDGDVTNPDNCGFAEIGWGIWPKRYGDSKRHVYLSYGRVDCDLPAKQIDGIVLPDGEFRAHDYRVTSAQSDPTKWKFRFDGNTWSKKIKQDFAKVPNVTCGGEVSTDRNAIGIAACKDMAYSNNDWSAWVNLPSFNKRVADGYRVNTISPNSWQAAGKN